MIREHIYIANDGKIGNVRGRGIGSDRVQLINKKGQHEGYYYRWQVVHIANGNLSDFPDSSMRLLIVAAKKRAIKLLAPLGALDGLSKQELKTYKAILRDIRWAHEEIKEQYDFTGRDTDKLASHLAYKYGIPITSDELKTITIKFPNARYRFEADNIVRIASPMNVRYEKRNYHVNDERLALAKERAIKLLTPLGDLPTVLNRDGYKVSFYSNDHEPPHVHVRGHGGSAIFKIAPVELRESSGYSLARLNKIRLILQENEQQLLEAWMSFFKK
ncbi:DUF4160 domain-containing protein [Rhodoflexus caldus]|uniref:DUF4160 domain-containing protein n=1 Tax=Rhodoflexus caldus TaxID=2891236 RepID=UPI00202AA420|nr:DUF4160 domain-containing protein [Rhodoflexus caldus]